MLYLLFYVRLHALTILAMRCFCVVARGCSVYILVAVWYSAVGTHVIYLPTLLLVGVPVCPCYHSAVTSLLTHAFWWAPVRVSHGYTPSRGIARSADGHMFSSTALYKFLISWQHLEFERCSIQSRLTALLSTCKGPTIWHSHSLSVSWGLASPTTPAQPA